MRAAEEDARVRGDTASVSECGHEAPLSQKHSADGGHSGPMVVDDASILACGVRTSVGTLEVIRGR